ESPKIVRIPAAAKQFTRSVALPEPTILFAHHGSADPTTEGWTLLYRQYGKGFPEKGKKLSAACPVGPIGEGGVAAWSFRPLKQDTLAGYTIRETKGLSPELQAEAREKGWVLRARVWISDQGPRPEQESEAPCIVGYRDDNRTWSFRVLLDPHGNQYVKGMDSRVDPIPGSRNQYVDYELRYDPIRKHAAFFVNGRHVGTHKGSPNRDTIDEDYESYPLLRFGTCFVPTEVRFANFEWGILRDNDKTQPKP
ncbi:MAG: hypothetical protein GX621_16595, partial [Pirellulaceae bacterium]|nr:hypothetical protein [Pirellulaceae bacterium]